MKTIQKMSHDSKIGYVNDVFLKKHIKVDAEWLHGCVEFFLEENATLSNDQLYEKAQEQWELSDLSDSGVPCLPQSIRKQKSCHEINGIFPVQMQYIIDISESAYDQLQKIRDKEVDMGKEQPEFKQSQPVKTKKNRVFKLELTDGHQIVTAMEYSQIPRLKTSLIPGIKMLLIGPIRCINHCLLIESKNIQILAGEVNTITITNAYENVLRRILNQPLNQNPKIEVTEQTVEACQNTDHISANRGIQQSHALTNDMDVDVFDDDDFFNDIDVDQMNSHITTVKNSRNDIQTTSESVMFLDDDMDQLLVKIEDVAEQNTHHLLTNNELSDNPSPQKPPLNVSICNVNYPFRIRGVNLVTLKQLNECSMDDKLRRKQFLVKAEIDAVQEKVRISRVNNTFKLGVLLKDVPAKLDRLQVRFSSDVLEKLANISPREIKEMFMKQESHPQVLVDIAEILDKLGMQLAELNAFLKIEFIIGANVPVVVEIIQSAKFLEQKLLEKLNSERLLD